MPRILFKLEDLGFQINIVVNQQLVRGIILYFTSEPKNGGSYVEKYFEFGIFNPTSEKNGT